MQRGLQSFVDLMIPPRAELSEARSPDPPQDLLRQWAEARQESLELERCIESHLDGTGRAIPPLLPGGETRLATSFSVPSEGPLRSERLREAASAAQAGRELPEFEYHGPVKRRLARLVARAVLFLLGIVTAPQRRFNELVLAVLAADREHGSAEREALLDHLREASAFQQRERLVLAQRTHDELTMLQGRFRRLELELLNLRKGLANATADIATLRLTTLELRRAQSLIQEPDQGASPDPEVSRS